MSDFDAVIDEYLGEHWELYPTGASSAGIDGHSGELGDYSAAAFEDRARRDDRWVERLRAVADDTLDPEQQIDRDLVISAHRGRQLLHDWSEWRRSADLYAGAGLSGVFGLFLRRFEAAPELTDAAVSRMEQIPGVIAHGKANLDPSLADAALLRRAIGQCHAGVAYFRDVVPAEVDEPALQARLAEAGTTAAEAYQDFAGFLDELAERATGSFALGEHRYSSAAARAGGPPLRRPVAARPRPGRLRRARRRDARAGPDHRPRLSR